MYYVYILKSKNNHRHYIGSCDNLQKRFAEHNNKKVKSTKSFVPWELTYYEAYTSKQLARKTEIFYKSSQGRRQIKKKLNLELNMERWQSGRMHQS